MHPEHKEQLRLSKRLSSYDRVEAGICSVLWATIAGVSAVLVSWLWHSQEDLIGTLVFLMLMLTGVTCSVLVWLQLFGARRKESDRP